jgi:RNA polymerase sigma-70 factor (ECF subfamily)
MMQTLTATTSAAPSFVAIYREHSPWIRAAVRRLGVPSWSIEDAVQDVFVVAHRRLEDFDGRELEGWLMVITRRVAFRHRRSALRQRRKLDALRLWLGLAPAERPWEAPEARLLLGQMLARLARDQHEAFEVCEVQGHTAMEAAQQLGVNPNTVATRLRAARIELRRVLVEPPMPRMQASRVAMARAYVLLFPRLLLGRLHEAVAIGAWALGTAVVVAIAIAKMEPRPEPAPIVRIASVASTPLASEVVAELPAVVPAPAEVVAPARAVEVAATPVRSVVAARPSMTPTSAEPLPRLDAELLAQAWLALDNGRIDDARRLVATHRVRHPDSPIAAERQRLEDRLAQLEH